MDFRDIPTPWIIFGTFNIMTERMIGGANRWTDFVKKWASDHDVTYTCAISLPDCKKEYYEMIGKTPKPAKPKGPPKESGSPWVRFVREWAKDNGMSYSCAVAMPECGAEYRKQTGAKANPKTLANQALRKASKQTKVRGRTAVSLAEMGKSAKAKVSKAEATISKAVATAVKKRRGRPPKVAEPELEYETNYTPPPSPKKIKARGPPAGPPPLSKEQVAEAKRNQKAMKMAQLRAERKAQGKSSSGKTFTKPRGSAPNNIVIEVLEEALPTESPKKGFSKATVDEIKASLLRRAEEAKNPPQVATATPTLVPPAPAKAKKATKASKAVDSKDAQQLVQETFNVLLSEDGDVDDGDWLRERGFPVPPQGLIGLNDNFVWFYTSPIAEREVEDILSRAIALAKSTYGVDVSRDSIIGYSSGVMKGHQSYFYPYQPDWETAERPSDLVIPKAKAPAKAKASKVKADFPTSRAKFNEWVHTRPKEVGAVFQKYLNDSRLGTGKYEPTSVGAIKWLRAMAPGRTNEELDALILRQYTPNEGDNWFWDTSPLLRAMRGQEFSDEWFKAKAEEERLEKAREEQEEKEREERWNQMIAEQTAKWKGRAKFVPPDSEYGMGHFQFLKPDKFGAFWCFTPKSDYYFGVVKPGDRGGNPLLFKFGEEMRLGNGAVKYYESVKDKVSSDRRFGGHGDDKEIFWDILNKSGSGYGGYFKIGSRSFGKKHGGMFEDDEIIEESGPYERAKPTEQELMGREDRRREELAEREADNLFDDDELVDDDDFLEGDEIVEESGPYPRPRPTEQEMMGREDTRTEDLANAEADRLLGKGLRMMVARHRRMGRGGEENPANSGNAFLDAITTIGHEAGKAHPASKFVNPFDAGFKFGEKVVAPALMKTKLGNPKTGIFSKKFWTIPKKKHH